jgi:peptidyl-prolyl cis-trans isomerase B (cyclophilin B)
VLNGVVDSPTHMATPKRERQKENHAAKVAAQRAAARRKRTQRILVWSGAAVVAVLAIAGLTMLGGGDDDPTPSTVADDSTVTTTGDATSETTSAAAGDPAEDYAGYRAQPTACGAEAPDEMVEMSFDEPVDQGLSGSLTATIETSCGPVEVALDADAYPETVNSFVFLAREGYFDGTACHRIVEGFMTQCGDPTATGLGDAGYSIPDEFPADGFVYERGVVAMANAGPGSTGSQFFIVTGDASFLPPTFSVLGTVVGSEDTLAALDAVPLAPRDNEVSNPLETVYIESVTIAG